MSKLEGLDLRLAVALEVGYKIIRRCRAVVYPDGMEIVGMRGRLDCEMQIKNAAPAYEESFDLILPVVRKHLVKFSTKIYFSQQLEKAFPLDEGYVDWPYAAGFVMEPADICRVYLDALEWEYATETVGVRHEKTPKGTCRNPNGKGTKVRVHPDGTWSWE